MTSIGRLIAARSMSVGACVALFVGGVGCSSPMDAPARVPTKVIITPNETVDVPSLGQLVEFTARVVDQNGREIPELPLIWSSENPAVLEPVNGPAFRSVSNGTTRIRARVDPDRIISSGSSSGVVEGFALVQVQQRSSTIKLAPSSGFLWATGQRSHVAVDLLDPRGRSVKRDLAILWSSDDESIATVDSQGFVTAVGDGTVRITAVAEGVTGHVTIRISSSLPYTACVSYGQAATEQCSAVTLRVRDARVFP